MMVPISGAGLIGLVSDLPPHELPMNAWSDGQNVRFREGKVEKSPGQANAYDPPSIVPYTLLPVPSASIFYWVYAGLTKVYVTDQSAHFDLTRAAGGDYLATADTNWTTANLGGVPILNNGFDDPQMWMPVSTAQRLQLLTNWPANTKANALRAYRNFLVALDVTQGGVRDPYRVKWSHQAAAGSVPSTWDPADTTKDAGEYQLVEGGDFLIDCVPMRDSNIIYKELSTWLMQYIGGAPIFRFAKLFLQSGIMSRRCAVEFFSGMHAVFTHDDLVRHDGQNVYSLLTNKRRRWLFNRIDTTNYRRCFVVAIPLLDEVWFCFPPTGSSFCTEAVVWNYKFDTISDRQLPGVTDIKTGVVDTNASPTIWDSDPGLWDVDASVWDLPNFNPVLYMPLMAGAQTTRLIAGNTGTQFQGVDFTAFVERQGIGLPPFEAGQPPDISSVKFCRGVWPRIEGTVGGKVNVYVGASMFPNVAPVYDPPQLFTIGTSRRIDCRVTGRLLAVKFETTDSTDWKLSGYELDVVKGGRF